MLGRVHQTLHGGRAVLLDIGADDLALLPGVTGGEGGQGIQGHGGLSLGPYFLCRYALKPDGIRGRKSPYHHLYREF